MQKIILTSVITLSIMGMIFYSISLNNNQDINRWLELTLPTKMPETYEEYVEYYQSIKMTEKEFIDYVEAEKNMTYAESTKAIIQYGYNGGENLLYFDYINRDFEIDEYEIYSKQYDQFLASVEDYNRLVYLYDDVY